MHELKSGRKQISAAIIDCCMYMYYKIPKFRVYWKSFKLSNAGAI